ncbi:MAG: hypothetical protein ACO3QC_00290 [Phycisphaerales bacterium]
MRILLDDCETSLQANTVAGALTVASDLVTRSGRMIVEVFVDGIAWSEEDLASGEYTARAAGEVRMTTAHPAELLRDTFAHAAEAVLNAEEIQRAAAKLMQANQVRAGFDRLLEALAVWGSVQTAVARGLELGVVTRDEVRAKGIDLEGALASLDRQLRSLRDSMVAQDAAAVSDCLLYEFPSTTKQFAATLAALANEAAAKAA